MASYLDRVPLSGIIRIRDMMYSVADPFRLDQGDVSFDAPDSVKSAMARAIAENKTHYLQTNGVPRLRELIAAKLRHSSRIPVDEPEDVLVTARERPGFAVVQEAGYTVALDTAVTPELADEGPANAEPKAACDLRPA